MEPAELNYARTAEPRRAGVWAYRAAWVAFWVSVPVLIASLAVSAISEWKTVELGEYDGTVHGARHYLVRVNSNLIDIYHMTKADMLAGDAPGEIELPFPFVILANVLVVVFSVVMIVVSRGQLSATIKDD